MGLRERPQQSQVHPVNGEAKAYDGEAGKDSNEDRENEKEGFFVKNTFESGEQATGSLESWPCDSR